MTSKVRHLVCFAAQPGSYLGFFLSIRKNLSCLKTSEERLERTLVSKTTILCTENIQNVLIMQKLHEKLRCPLIQKTVSAYSL